MEYNYEYIPHHNEFDSYIEQKVLEANVARSMALDGKRLAMAPTATDLANRARAGRARSNGA